MLSIKTQKQVTEINKALIMFGCRFTVSVIPIRSMKAVPKVSIEREELDKAEALFPSSDIRKAPANLANEENAIESEEDDGENFATGAARVNAVRRLPSVTIAVNEVVGRRQAAIPFVAVKMALISDNKKTNFPRKG
jgi:hypothetical protein